jgi:hypothetical protein
MKLEIARGVWGGGFRFVVVVSFGFIFLQSRDEDERAK